MYKSSPSLYFFLSATPLAAFFFFGAFLPLASSLWEDQVSKYPPERPERAESRIATRGTGVPSEMFLAVLLDLVDDFELKLVEAAGQGLEIGSFRRVVFRQLLASQTLSQDLVSGSYGLRVVCGRENLTLGLVAVSLVASPAK